MKIIFMGTPDFSVPTLETLINSKHDVIGVVAQPDRPKGRGKKLVSPPTIDVAKAHGIPVKQPLNARSKKFLEWLQQSKADIAVVVAYGKILSRKVLTTPKLGCINHHASLLPKYRGAAPIHWAVINGELETGVCTMQMDEGMDTGPVFMEQKLSISPNDTTGNLWETLSKMGAPLVLETLERIEQKSIKPRSQVNDLATYAPMISKNDALIDWNRPVKDIFNKIRGMTPWPGAWCLHRENRLKVWKTEISGKPSTSDPTGTIVGFDSGILVNTSDGILRICQAQLPGKKQSSALDLINSKKIAIQDRLH